MVVQHLMELSTFSSNRLIHFYWSTSYLIRPFSTNIQKYQTFLVIELNETVYKCITCSIYLFKEKHQITATCFVLVCLKQIYCSGLLTKAFHCFPQNVGIIFSTEVLCWSQSGLLLKKKSSELETIKQEAHGPHRSPEQKSLAIDNLKQKSLYQHLIQKKNIIHFPFSIKGYSRHLNKFYFRMLHAQFTGN